MPSSSSSISLSSLSSPPSSSFLIASSQHEYSSFSTFPTISTVASPNSQTSLGYLIIGCAYAILCVLAIVQLARMRTFIPIVMQRVLKVQYSLLFIMATLRSGSAFIDSFMINSLSLSVQLVLKVAPVTVLPWLLSCAIVTWFIAYRTLVHHESNRFVTTSYPLIIVSSIGLTTAVIVLAAFIAVGIFGLASVNYTQLVLYTNIFQVAVSMAVISLCIISGMVAVIGACRMKEIPPSSSSSVYATDEEISSNISNAAALGPLPVSPNSVMLNPTYTNARFHIRALALLSFTTSFAFTSSSLLTLYGLVLDSATYTLSPAPFDTSAAACEWSGLIALNLLYDRFVAASRVDATNGQAALSSIAQAEDRAGVGKHERTNSRWSRTNTSTKPAIACLPPTPGVSVLGSHADSYEQTPPLHQAVSVGPQQRLALDDVSRPVTPIDDEDRIILAPDAIARINAAPGYRMRTSSYMIDDGVDDAKVGIGHLRDDDEYDNDDPHSHTDSLSHVIVVGDGGLSRSNLDRRRRRSQNLGVKFLDLDPIGPHEVYQPELAGIGGGLLVQLPPQQHPSLHIPPYVVEHELSELQPESPRLIPALAMNAKGLVVVVRDQERDQEEYDNEDDDDVASPMLLAKQQQLKANQHIDDHVNYHNQNHHALQEHKLDVDDSKRSHYNYDDDGTTIILSPPDTHSHPPLHRVTSKDASTSMPPGLSTALTTYDSAIVPSQFKTPHHRWMGGASEPDRMTAERMITHHRDHSTTWSTATTITTTPDEKNILSIQTTTLVASMAQPINGRDRQHEEKMMINSNGVKTTPMREAINEHIRAHVTESVKVG